MSRIETVERLEAVVIHLVDGILSRKDGSIAFLLDLNHLDDIHRSYAEKSPVPKELADAISRIDFWLHDGSISDSQRTWLGEYLGQILELLAPYDDSESRRLSHEIRDRLKSLGQGILRMTLAPLRQESSLTERFSLLLGQECEEVKMLSSQRDHLLSCLDDTLKSAEAKSDPLYRHLAASMIYFLQLEGYKVDPYIKRLRELRGLGEGKE